MTCQNENCDGQPAEAEFILKITDTRGGIIDQIAICGECARDAWSFNLYSLKLECE